MKSITLIALIVSSLLILSYISYQYVDSQQQSTIFQRKQFKKHIKNTNSTLLQSNEEDYNILTYSVNLGLGIQENDSSNEEISLQKNEIQTTAHIMFDYLPETKQFDIVVAYSKYHQETYNNEENIQVNINSSEFKKEDSYVYENTLVYKLLVEEESGDILSMYVPDSSHQNELVQWGTQELINSIFPDIRSGSYINATPMEQDSIGQFQPHLKQIKTSEEIAQLEKHYDSNDYSQFEVEGVVAPAVDYNRTLFVDIDSGVVLGGDSEYEYSIGKGGSTNVMTDGEITLSTNLQSIDIEIETNFYLQSDSQYTKEQAKNLFQFVQKSKFEFIEIQLAKYKKGENFIQQQQQSSYGDKLTQAELYSQSSNLVQFTILSQDIKLDLDILITSIYSSAQTNVKVNDQIIQTLFQQNIEHCQDFSNSLSDSIKIPLFKASWPVGGLVTVPVEAFATFKYGITLSGSQNDEVCNYSLVPALSAELFGDGKASLAGIVSAGLYAKGTFIDTNLTLEMNLQKSSGQADIELHGSLQPVAFEFGGVYNMITCDAEKILSFEWKNICEVGKDQFHTFLEKSTEPITKSFWKTTVQQ